MGAIIVDSLERPQKVVAARRIGPEKLRGYWEFPGGKLEPAETAHEALERELDEELSLAVRIGAEHARDGKPWPISGSYELRLFFVEVVNGVVAPGPDHDAVKWLSAENLQSVPWLPSDAEAVSALQAFLRTRV